MRPNPKHMEADTEFANEAIFRIVNAGTIDARVGSANVLPRVLAEILSEAHIVGDEDRSIGRLALLISGLAKVATGAPGGLGEGSGDDSSP